jgi:hypothetical protein
MQVTEIEGEHAVDGPELESGMYAKPLKIPKVNIVTKDNPKFTHIGDYWNE